MRYPIREGLKRGAIVLGYWAVASVAMPIPKLYQDELSVFQFMFIRGLITMAMAVFVAKAKGEKITRPNWLLALMALCFATSAIGYFLVANYWSLIPATVMFVGAPALNQTIAWWRGKKVDRFSIIGLAALVASIAIALQPWQTNFKWVGALLTLFPILGFTTYIEVNEVVKKTHSPLTRCFWQALGLTLVGGMGMSSTGVGHIADHLPILIGFGIGAGLVYWLLFMAIMNAFPPTKSSILLVAETPFIIIGSALLIPGEHIGGIIAICGIAASICVAARLVIHWMPKQEQEKAPTEINAVSIAPSTN